MILINALPKNVEISGVRHEIETDFRVWVEFELLIQNDGDLASVIPKLFPNGVPRDIHGAIEAIKGFYCCGTITEKKPSAKAGVSKQPYAFDVDGNAIVADFWHFYNIDLTEEGLHWWVFRALLEGLPEKSEFKQRVYYRTCDMKGLSKKERERIMKIRSRIEIKNKGGKPTLEERNESMKDYITRRMAELSGGGMNG